MSELVIRACSCGVLLAGGVNVCPMCRERDGAPAAADLEAAERARYRHATIGIRNTLAGVIATIGDALPATNEQVRMVDARERALHAIADLKDGVEAILVHLGPDASRRSEPIPNVPTRAWEAARAAVDLSGLLLTAQPSIEVEKEADPDREPERCGCEESQWLRGRLAEAEQDAASVREVAGVVRAEDDEERRMWRERAEAAEAEVRMLRAEGSGSIVGAVELALSKVSGRGLLPVNGTTIDRVNAVVDLVAMWEPEVQALARLMVERYRREAGTVPGTCIALATHLLARNATAASAAIHDTIGFLDLESSMLLTPDAPWPVSAAGGPVAGHEAISAERKDRAARARDLARRLREVIR